MRLQLLLLLQLILLFHMLLLLQLLLLLLLLLCQLLLLRQLLLIQLLLRQLLLIQLLLRQLLLLQLHGWLRVVLKQQGLWASQGGWDPHHGCVDPVAARWGCLPFVRAWCRVPLR